MQELRALLHEPTEAELRAMIAQAEREVAVIFLRMEVDGSPRYGRPYPAYVVDGAVDWRLAEQYLRDHGWDGEPLRKQLAELRLTAVTAS